MSNDCLDDLFYIFGLVIPSIRTEYSPQRIRTESVGLTCICTCSRILDSANLFSICSICINAKPCHGRSVRSSAIRSRRIGVCCASKMPRRQEDVSHFSSFSIISIISIISITAITAIAVTINRKCQVVLDVCLFEIRGPLYQSIRSAQIWISCLPVRPSPLHAYMELHPHILTL